MLPAAAPPGRAERGGAGRGAGRAAGLLPRPGWAGLGRAGRAGPCVRRPRSTCAAGRAAGEAPERGRASPAGRGITPPGANPAQGAAPAPGPAPPRPPGRCAAPGAAASRTRAEPSRAGPLCLRGGSGRELRPGPAARSGATAASAARSPGPGAESPVPVGIPTRLGARGAGALGGGTPSFGKDAVDRGV
ncbi:unnamed protein product, partial [Bubo scandiacus]